MPSYSVEHPIRYDGQRRAAGETVEMPKDVAAPLLDRGYLRQVAADGDGGAKSGGKGAKGGRGNPGGEG